MKMPREWKPAFEGAATVDDVLKNASLTSESDHAHKNIPAYGYRMDLWIIAGLSSSLDKSKRDLDRMVDDYNDEASQLEMFTDEELRAQEKDRLLSVLETRLQLLGAPEILFYDGEYGDIGVTVRGAAKSQQLWAKAGKVIHKFSLCLRDRADLANSCVKIHMEIHSRDQWDG
jgi:hypothetical protein